MGYRKPASRRISELLPKPPDQQSPVREKSGIVSASLNAIAMHRNMQLRGRLLAPRRPPACALHFHALRCNLLQLPFLSEFLIELLELSYKVLACLDDCVSRAQLPVCLHAHVEDGEQRVRDLVGGEDDVRGFDELRAEEIAERVVLLVESEHGRIRNA